MTVYEMVAIFPSGRQVHLATARNEQKIASKHKTCLLTDLYPGRMWRLQVNRVVYHGDRVRSEDWLPEYTVSFPRVVPLPPR